MWYAQAFDADNRLFGSETIEDIEFAFDRLQEQEGQPQTIREAIYESCRQDVEESRKLSSENPITYDGDGENFDDETIFH